MGVGNTASFPSSLPSSLSGSPRLVRGLQPQPPSSRGGRGSEVPEAATARVSPKLASHLRHLLGGEALRSASSFRRHLLLLLLQEQQRPREGRLQYFLWKSRSIQLLLSILPPPPRVFAGWGLRKGGRSRARWLLSLLPSASDRPPPPPTFLLPDLLVAFCRSAVASRLGHPPTHPGLQEQRPSEPADLPASPRAPPLRLRRGKGKKEEEARGAPGSRSASPMGSLLSGVSFKEPTTVEDCDSTWETDSEPELQDPGGEEGQPLEQAGGGGDGDDPAADRQQQQQSEEPLPAAGGRPEAAEKREGAAEEEEEVVEKEEEKEGGDGVAEEDEAEGREQGETEAPGPEQGDDSVDVTAKPKRSFYAARDLYKYRHQYPQNFKELRYQNDLCNLRFYKNKIPFKPDGVYIEEVLNKWKGDYEKLEHNHTYIQWLFPLREQGLNFYAKELTTCEIEEFKKTKEAIRRFLLAYKMMLEFFGIKLIDKTGNVARAANWQERFQHLNESQHNYLRITRILKSLGELGYESFKPPLVKLILHEALVEETIPNIKQSALEYFVYTIRDRRERRKLLRFAQQHYTPSDHFIWGPPKKQKPEGSKPSKKLASPVSLRNSSTCKHKKTKELKNVSEICNSRNKTNDEKKTEHIKNGTDSDQSKKTGSPEVVKQSSMVKNSSAECHNSKMDIVEPLNQKETISHLKKHKGKNKENVSQDCKHLEDTEKDSCETKNDSTNISSDMQDNICKDKNLASSSVRNKE
ncbi:opioid growth factor receptor-like protein 1 isoform X2 [Notechis scutatus]|uniref:Opioid growth factor receptor-like protein 1 isoform X2 n=1 Tax=Notechis scutatus TaxID=8663 RepID=A0A6J1TQT9_9SAUR|nr:opioid growth factor receptor-like protein 1 isoform X2 [Notechis scutatus]